MHHWPARPYAVPPLGALRVFCISAKLGGFRRAADDLNLTPGAVAHQIKKLEDWLGVTLFTRLAKGVELTPAGERYAKVIGTLLEDIARATDEIRREVSSTAVAISAPPSFAARWLLPRIAHLRNSEPELEVRVLASLDAVDFTRDRVDLVVSEAPDSNANIVSEEILPEYWAPVCSPSYLASRSFDALDDLLPCTLLHDEPWPGTPRQLLWEDWLAIAELSATEVQQNLYFSHSHLTIDAAIAGHGVALANIIFVADDLFAGHLVAPTGSWLNGPYSLHLMATKHTLRRPGVEVMWHWIRAQAQIQRSLIERLVGEAD